MKNFTLILIKFIFLIKKSCKIYVWIMLLMIITLSLTVKQQYKTNLILLHDNEKIKKNKEKIEKQFKEHMNKIHNAKKIENTLHRNNTKRKEKFQKDIRKIQKIIQKTDLDSINIPYDAIKQLQQHAKRIS